MFGFGFALFFRTLFVYCITKCEMASHFSVNVFKKKKKKKKKKKEKKKKKKKKKKKIIHLSCAHQRPECSHVTYLLKYDILDTCRA